MKLFQYVDVITWCLQIFLSKCKLMFRFLHQSFFTVNYLLNQFLHIYPVDSTFSSNFFTSFTEWTGYKSEHYSIVMYLPKTAPIDSIIFKEKKIKN